MKKVTITWDDIESLSAWQPLPLDMPVLTRAFAVQRRYGLSCHVSYYIRFLPLGLSPRT